ncbi:hypothetical protein [Dysgonomonas gadei]|uniref:Uncharacterized protein n=1 Tax=Dysgonomonas gadei ATCC BAA-286 TaxID=742766 RepID=F5IVG2_9BACT|nr:hypothetical protein [Dysgonomonas gadei]EGK02612.1 hypothetical protein HMPREF9455_00862 [Dysgonomonas gadei ATCC BAA-286]
MNSDLKKEILKIISDIEYDDTSIFEKLNLYGTLNQTIKYFENLIQTKYRNRLNRYLKEYTKEYYVYIDEIINHYCNVFKEREYKNILLEKELRLKIIDEITREIKIEYIGEDYYISKDYYTRKNY